MGSRFPSHQLSNGLYVSGLPEQPKEKQQLKSSMAMPYTGGDIKKSGELGKMFDVPMDNAKSKKSGPIPSSTSNRAGSFGGVASHSGPITPNSASRTSGPVLSSSVAGASNKQKSSSGPLGKHGEPIKKSSGPQSVGVTPMNSGSLAPILPTTGLITSGPLGASGVPKKFSGPIDSSGAPGISVAAVHRPAITVLGQEKGYSFIQSFSKPILWGMVLLFLMGFIAGGFILGAVHNSILLVVVVGFAAAVTALILWNFWLGDKVISGFMAQFPDAELRTAKDGQYVKVTGIVTCGNVPLESSFQKVPRCIYTSASLQEYRGLRGRSAGQRHKPFTWGLRSLERHVVEFYISDFQSGLRALVKAGYGAKVTPYVDETVVVETTGQGKDVSPEFIRWLAQRNLSSDDRAMRLKEGYIKEGSTVSVMGIVHRNENVLMIVPPPEPISTGCQWTRLSLPISLEGIVLRCEDASKIDVIPV